MPQAARYLGIVCLVAAGLLCPPTLRGLFGTLDWQIGDVTTPLSVLAGLLAVLGLLVLALRERVDRALARSFQTTRHYQFLAVGLVFTAGLCLGMAELGLRVLQRPFKDSVVPTENAVAQFDEDLGWSYRPSFTKTQPFGDPPRDVPLAFEAHGFRAATATAAARPNVPSVLLVGGSFTMGHGVTWRESLAGQLAGRPEVPGQVVNLAVQGFGTDQALLRLRRHIAQLSPTAVVYGFICSHVRRNANQDRRILFPGARFLGTKPRFSLGGGGLEQVDRPLRYEDVSYSRIGAYLEVAWTHYGPRPTLELTRALVQALDAEAKAAGAKLIVVNWQMGAEAPVTCGARPLEGLGVEVIRPAEDPPEGWSNWVIPGDYHPTARAHAHVADLVVARLAELGLTRTATTPR